MVGAILLITVGGLVALTLIGVSEFLWSLVGGAGLFTALHMVLRRYYEQQGQAG